MRRTRGAGTGTVTTSATTLDGSIEGSAIGRGAIDGVSGTSSQTKPCDGAEWATSSLRGTADANATGAAALDDVTGSASDTKLNNETDSLRAEDVGLSAASGILVIGSAEMPQSSCSPCSLGNCANGSCAGFTS